MDILKEDEEQPVSHPFVDGLSEDASDEIKRNAIWQRIESYICHRFAVRRAVWVIEGLEDEALKLPLCPIVSITAEKWEGNAWVSVSLPDGPLGYVLPSEGVFRITAQVGAAPVPADVQEAYRRLAEYSAEIGDRGLLKDAPGATSYSASLASNIQESFSRQAAWAARAIQNSGAGDLLRPYRRA